MNNYKVCRSNNNNKKKNVGVQKYRYYIATIRTT